MSEPQPPRDHDALTVLLHARLAGMSRANRQIARFLLTYPNEAAMLPVNGIGARCGVHGTSVVRFAQALGFRGFKDLQVLFQARLRAETGPARPVLPPEAQVGGRSDLDRLTGQVAQDRAALDRLAGFVSHADLSRAADVLAAADVICVIGAARAGPVTEALQDGLIRLGRRCWRVAPGEALSHRVVEGLGARDALVSVGFGHTGELDRPIETAARRGAPVVVLSEDGTSAAALRVTASLRLPPRHVGVPPPIAPAISLAQGLVASVAARLRDNWGHLDGP